MSDDRGTDDDDVNDDGRGKFLWKDSDIEVVTNEPAKPPPKPAKSKPE